MFRINDCDENSSEQRLLEEEIIKMKSLLLEKDQKIEQLEKIINSKKENASTQVGYIVGQTNEIFAIVLPLLTSGKKIYRFAANKISSIIKHL